MLKKVKDLTTLANLFLTGGASTGKAFTLLLLVQGLLCQYDAKLPMALLMAYTGKDAHKIGGTTIHSGLHLPLLINMATSLSFNKLAMLSTSYKNLQLIVTNEISLVGARMFYLADSLLQAIMYN